MVTTFTFLFDFSNFRATFSDFVDGQQNNTPRLILIKYQYPVHSALHCTVLSCISLYFIVINTAHCTSTENPTMHCKLPFAILFDVNEHTKQNTGGQLPPPFICSSNDDNCDDDVCMGSCVTARLHYDVELKKIIWRSKNTKAMVHGPIITHKQIMLKLRSTEARTKN